MVWSIESTMDDDVLGSSYFNKKEFIHLVFLWLINLLKTEKKEMQLN
jgi:hypothetical protein